MAEEIQCPECSEAIPAVASDVDQELVCPTCDHSFAQPPHKQAVNHEPEETEEELQAKIISQRIEATVALLPPKFLANDPDFVDYRVNRTKEAKVLLPDATGGVQSVDSNIVKIHHKGKTIELVALPPEQRRKRQRIINVISITIGAVFLYLFFLLLNQ